MYDTISTALISLTRFTSLGYAEMYIVLASVFRRLNLQLHETYQERDIDIVRDCFIGEVSPQTQGVRVKYAAARD
jgi:hypothetical protein